MDLKSKNYDVWSLIRSASKKTATKKAAPKNAAQASEKSENSCGANQKLSGRCLNPGPVGRNPYLNYLREFRKKNCGLSATETIRRGAKAWNALPQEEKRIFIEEAFYAPKLKRRRRSRSRSMSAASKRRRSKSAASSRSRSRSRGKAGHCLKPGPIGRNPYLNFLREFRKKNCGLSAVETVQRGAKEWIALPQEQKRIFIEEAFYARKLKRSRRSRSRSLSAASVRSRSKSRGKARTSRRARRDKRTHSTRRGAISC